VTNSTKVEVVDEVGCEGRTKLGSMVVGAELGSLNEILGRGCKVLRT